MELSRQETALILSQREPRKNAVASGLAGALLIFFSPTARAPATPTSALLARS
jgi:hypothetical protein